MRMRRATLVREGDRFISGWSITPRRARLRPARDQSPDALTLPGATAPVLPCSAEAREDFEWIKNEIVGSGRFLRHARARSGRRAAGPHRTGRTKGLRHEDVCAYIEDQSSRI
jgi:hypothetical protein